MPGFLPEPKDEHGTIAKTAILLINLGTPEAPTAPAVRRYLKQFLSDPRVVEIPRALWWPVLNGIILNTRPKHSAQKVCAHLEHGRLAAESTYGTPGATLARISRPRHSTAARGGIRHALRRAIDCGGAVEAEDRGGCERILVLPLYPQYAASTTASAFDAVTSFLRHTRNVPEIRTVKHYHDHPAYIGALAGLVREHWQSNGRPDKLVMSFPRPAALYARAR